MTAQNFSLQSLKNLLRQIDWKLLLFLIIFLNVKLLVKIVAVIIIYLLRPDWKLGMSWNNSRLPLFYVLIPAIAIMNGFFYGSFTSAPNSIAIATGIGFWILCLLAVHQVKLSVEQNNVAVLHNTVLVFFAINIFFSLLNLANIVFEIGDINPYRYQGNFQKYFIGTGDYIKGVSFDSSTTNAVINAFAVVYFLTREKAIWVLLSMTGLLLTGSNFTNLILLSTLALLFIFKSSANQKSIIIVCSAMLVIFLSKVSPQNDTYILTGLNNYLFHQKSVVQPAAAIVRITEREDSSLSEEEKMQKIAQLYLDSLSVVEAKDKMVMAEDSARIKPVIPAPSIHSVPFQRKHDTSELQKTLTTFANANQISLFPIESPGRNNLHLGKLVGAAETINFFKSHPKKIITGNGIGNFSSKLAFRTAALNIVGGYPTNLRYINEDFKNNHLSLFLSYFTRDKENHSIINSPNSTYDQLLSEYGLLGVAFFFIFYIGFFISNIKKLTYGIPLLLLLGAVFFVEYWFEQLSVVIIFELLLLLNIKEPGESLNTSNG
ncbi:MAG TPA: hypothetical protein VLJ41_08560 [Segetibacter sp.]|nr:hypothetical protein [Segetibacter sp.]